jgi:hypothetical protein
MTSPGVPMVRGRQSSKHNIGIWGVLLGSSLVALLFVGTCGRSAYRSYETAESAVERFHGQLDNGEYEEPMPTLPMNFEAQVPASKNSCECRLPYGLCCRAGG